jgi:hypothetical protein
VGETAVGADGKDLYTQLLELGILDGNCRQFRRSDKGKVTGVEAQYDPLAAIVRQLDVLKALSNNIRRELEIGGFFTNTRRFHTNLLFLGGTFGAGFLRDERPRSRFYTGFDFF